MPLFMDVHHDMPEMTKSQVDEAHAKDLELQGPYDVEFLKAWYDPGSGKIFCLSRAESKDGPLAVHAKAGHPAAEIYEVQEFD